MSSSNVEKIKEKLGIEEVIGSYIKLDRAGKNLKGKCPFHNEKTPSFFVSPERGSYYCFGCGAKGDIFNFIEQFEGLDFMGSLKLLAERAGVSLEFDRNNEEYKTEKEKLLAIMEDATVFFEKNLSHSKEAQDYVKSRGITSDTAHKFRLGYIPADWRLLYTYLIQDKKSQKYTDADIEKAGLIKRPDAGDGGVQKGYYDRFRGRIMFPISDSSGRVIAFSGRILVDDGKSAKYLNSPDTILYNKSTVLYGIDKAKQDIRIKNYSIMVEGQMDLVLSHQAGIRNTVAVSGTALTDSIFSKENTVNNLGIVKRLSNNIILAFDSDNAGRKAAMRSATIAMSLGMDVKIADLPEGKDPADLVLSNPEEWKNVLRNSKPVVEFQINTVLKQNLDPRKLPKALRDNVFPFIAPITGAMEKAHYIKLIKEKTGLSEESIKEDLIKTEASLMNSNEEAVAGVEKIGEKNGIESKINTVVRKLFGLLSYLEKEPENNALIAGHREDMKRIAGSRFENMLSTLGPYKNELLLEAEVNYGLGADKKEVLKDLEELLINFEEDIIRQEFAIAMAELAKAEREKDSKNIEGLVKKCQTLSMRISELSKKKFK